MADLFATFVRLATDIKGAFDDDVADVIENVEDELSDLQYDAQTDIANITDVVGGALSKIQIPDVSSVTAPAAAATSNNTVASAGASPVESSPDTNDQVSPLESAVLAVIAPSDDAGDAISAIVAAVVPVLGSSPDKNELPAPVPSTVPSGVPNAALSPIVAAPTSPIVVATADADVIPVAVQAPSAPSASSAANTDAPAPAPTSTERAIAKSDDATPTPKDEAVTAKSDEDAPAFPTPDVPPPYDNGPEATTSSDDKAASSSHKRGSSLSSSFASALHIGRKKGSAKEPEAEPSTLNDDDLRRAIYKARQAVAIASGGVASSVGVLHLSFGASSATATKSMANIVTANNRRKALEDEWAKRGHKVLKVRTRDWLGPGSYGFATLGLYKNE